MSLTGNGGWWSRWVSLTLSLSRPARNRSPPSPLVRFDPNRCDLLLLKGILLHAASHIIRNTWDILPAHIFPATCYLGLPLQVQCNVTPNLQDFKRNRPGKWKDIFHQMEYSKFYKFTAGPTRMCRYTRRINVRYKAKPL